jgi:hypothetical protein
VTPLSAPGRIGIRCTDAVLDVKVGRVQIRVRELTYNPRPLLVPKLGPQRHYDSVAVGGVIPRADDPAVEKDARPERGAMNEKWPAQVHFHATARRPFRKTTLRFG